MIGNMDMRIGEQPAICNSNTIDSAGNVNENEVAVFQKELKTFQKAFDIANATIRKHRTVNIFSHNPEGKTGLDRFKQILDNIGHNIAVLARNKGNAIEAENKLQQLINALDKTMVTFKEEDFKNFLKDGKFKACLDTIKTYVEKLDHLYGYNENLKSLNGKLNNVWGYLSTKILMPTMSLKQNFLEWSDKIGTRKGENDFDNAVYSELEQFLKDKDAIKGSGILKGNPKLQQKYDKMCAYSEIADAIREVKGDKEMLLHNILQAYTFAKSSVDANDPISKELFNLLDKTCTDAILKKSTEIQKLKESIAHGNDDINDLRKTAEQQCKMLGGVMTEGLKTFFDNLGKVPNELNVLDNALHQLEENNKNFSANTFIGEREKFEKTFQTENQKIQDSLDKIQKRIDNHPDKETKGHLQELLNAKKTLHAQIQQHFNAIKDLNRLDDSIRKLNGELGNNDGVTFESVGKHIEQCEANIGKLPKNDSGTKLQTSLNDLKTDFENLSKVRSAFKEIQTKFSEFIKNLSKVKDPKQKESLLTKHYTDIVLPQMEQKFQEMDPTIRKAFRQNIYDIAKKGTRDMYVNYLKGIK